MPAAAHARTAVPPGRCGANGSWFRYLWGQGAAARARRGGSSRPSVALPVKSRVLEGSVGALGRASRVGLLDFFLGLVAGSGTTGRANRATDDRAGRSGDRAADQGAGCAATKGTGACTGLVIAFGRLTGDRSTDGADRATDDGARGASDGHAHGRAAESACSGAHRFGAAFLVLWGRTGTATLVQEVVIVRVVMGCRRVVVHWGPPWVRISRQVAG